MVSKSRVHPMPCHFGIGTPPQFNPSDAVLMRRRPRAFRDGLKAGNTAVWREAFERYNETLRDRLLGRGCPPADVADVEQETWLRMWLNRTKFRGGGAEGDQLRDMAAFRAWMIRIAVSVEFHRRRSQRHDGAGLGDDQVSIPSFEDHLLERIDHSTVATKVACLPKAERTVLELRLLRGLSVGQVADVLHVPTGTVKSRTHRALDRLRIGFGTKESRQK